MVLIEQPEQVQVDHISLIRCSRGDLLEVQKVAEILQMCGARLPSTAAHSHSSGSWTKLIQRASTPHL